jgi:hypothetical protein
MLRRAPALPDALIFKFLIFFPFLPLSLLLTSLLLCPTAWLDISPTYTSFASLICQAMALNSLFISTGREGFIATPPTYGCATRFI